MKKILIVLFVLGLGFSAFAQNLTLDYPITVRVASDPIDLQGITDTVSFGTLSFGQTALSNLPQGQPRSTVNNAGYATIDYTARAEITSGSWTLGSNPGANTAVLYGIFTYALGASDDPPGRDVLLGDFGTEDRLGGTAIRASNTVLTRNDETNPENRGNNVYTTMSFRSLRYRLDTPTSGDTSEQTITVTIGAIAL